MNASTSRDSTDIIMDHGSMIYIMCSFSESHGKKGKGLEANTLAADIPKDDPEGSKGTQRKASAGGLS